MAAGIVGTPLEFTTLSPGNYTPESGSSRLVRLRFSLESDSGAAPSAIAATLGGVNFVEVSRRTYTGGGKTMTIWRGYILHANIPTGAQAVVVSVTGGTGNQGYAGEIATLDGCGQTGLTNVSAAGTVGGTPLPLPPSGTLSYADGDLVDVIIGHDRTPPIATAAGWSFSNIVGSGGGDAGMTKADRVMSGAGTISVSVALAGGGSNAVGDMWVIPALVASATITNVAPASGSPAGGTAVTLTGTGFESGDGVRFGANDATSVVVVNATTIICVTPAGSAGAVDVHLRRGGSTVATAAGGYTYVAPALDSFEIIETGGGALADFFVGSPRTIRIRALDQYGAVLTSFTSTVTVDVTGSILSAGAGTSGSFTSGVLDLSVTFSALGTGVELDVAGTSDPSKVGLSDPFDVVLPPSAGGATRRIGSGSPYFGF